MSAPALQLLSSSSRAQPQARDKFELVSKAPGGARAPSLRGAHWEERGHPRAAGGEKAQWAPRGSRKTTARASRSGDATRRSTTRKSRGRYESAAAPTNWLSQDPLGAVDSYNLYAFNKFDPVNFVDPWGLATKNPKTGEWETVVTGKREVTCDSACQARAEQASASLAARSDAAEKREAARERQSDQLSRPKMAARLMLSMAISSVDDTVRRVQKYGRSYAKSWNEVFDLTGTEKVDEQALEKANLATTVISLGMSRGAGPGPALGIAGGGVSILGFERLAAMRAALLAGAVTTTTVVLSQGGEDKPKEPLPAPASPEKPSPGTRGPVAGGGGDVKNISAEDALRIQNAANRIGEPIHVVGSRAKGTARPG